MMDGTDAATTLFLTVDLDLAAKESLASLLQAFEGVASPLYEDEPTDQGLRSTLELDEECLEPEESIRRFLSVVLALPAPLRAQWDAASHRVFDIGLSAGTALPAFHLSLGPSTLQTLASVGASLAVTVYPAELQPRVEPVTTE